MRQPKPAGELQFVEFIRPTLSDSPPAGEGWIHEVKFDGYRTQLVIEAGQVRAFTRNGYDWTEKYWPIALAAQALPCTTAIIDGEMIANNEQGISDLSALVKAIGKEPGRLAFVAFDLLHLDGRDLRAKPLIERKAELKVLLRGCKAKIQYSEHFETDGSAFFTACNGMGLEGIVSKRADSRYRSGPSKDWLKTKCFAEADFEVVGVSRNPGEPAMALLSRPGRGYVGKAFVTLDRATKDRFWSRIAALKGKAAPKGIKQSAGVQWVKPGLVGRVQYLKGEGGLRHASLKDFREMEH
jgi:bifunctional non-homologous end joining protein LigD